VNDITRTPYELLGGAEALRRLTDRFYDVMDAAPEAKTLRAMHGADLGPMRDKLFDFMSGWLGGPPLYSQRTGSVCITRAHQPFAIDAAARDQWLWCMERAMDDVAAPDAVRQMVRQPLGRMAEFLRNR
jgi:hemoglobin